MGNSGKVLHIIKVLHAKINASNLVEIPSTYSLINHLNLCNKSVRRTSMKKMTTITSIKRLSKRTARTKKYTTSSINNTTASI